MGKNNSEFVNFRPVHRNALILCEESDRKAWESGGTLRIEEVIQQPDGTCNFFDFIKVPVFDANGRRQALVIIGRDITERIQAEKLLKESERRLRSLVEHNPDAICMFDQEGNFLSVNPATERITGYSEEELLQQSFQSLIFWSDLEKTMEYFKRTLKGEPQTYEKYDPS